MRDSQSQSEWDHVVDFLVAGSGGAGMVGALAAHDAGLSTLVVEKDAKFGGSTSLSGGVLWIPDNAILRKHGKGDSREDVLTYLRAVVGDRVEEARLAAYAERGPEVVDLLLRISRHNKFTYCKGYSDYHPELPEGRPAGRSIEPKPIDSRRLGDDEPNLLTFDLPSPMGVWFTGYEARQLMMFRRTWKARSMLLVAGWRVVSNVFRRRRMKTLGAALIARLFLTMKDLGIPLWLNSPILELIEEDGAVVGAVVRRDGSPVRVRARKGVLLATGGFEHNAEMRKEFLPELGWTDYSAGAAGNTGDGHRLGVAAGAQLDLMDDAWWMPSIALPRGGVFPLVSERCIPPMVIVGPDGERFTNESEPYVNFVHTQFEAGQVPCFEIFDAKARSRYQFSGILPGKKFPGSFYKSGLVTQADSLAELADLIGVPSANLVATVERFNGSARAGIDHDFGRGKSAYDHYYGDPTLPVPNMDTIDAGPYYAVRIAAGDLGTKGGIVTDSAGRALGVGGAPIAGLYASGNVSAAVMGNDYAGAGATIGPAMVFAYLAAEHAATRSVNRKSDA